MTNTKTFEQQINELQAGGSTRPIVTEHASTWVERSGDGRMLRFVRKEDERETVYHSYKF